MINRRSIIDDVLRARVQRLLAGEHRVEDLDRLFLEQRDRHHGKESFREIGDFVAHRSERNKGLVTQTARDVFTSIDVWSLPARGRKPSMADIRRAAWANFRLASDEQLKRGCGCARKATKHLLETGFRNLAAGELVDERQWQTVLYLGNRFFWKPAFTDAQLFAEFCSVALKNGLLTRQETSKLGNARSFLALYAIALLHGSSVAMPDGLTGELLAGFSNKERRLEVKVQVAFTDGPKPILAPICMFLTGLEPEDFCEIELLKPSTEALPHVWLRAVELKPSGRLGLVAGSFERPLSPLG